MSGKSDILRNFKPLIFFSRVCGSSVIHINGNSVFQNDYNDNNNLKMIFWFWSYIVVIACHFLKGFFYPPQVYTSITVFKILGVTACAFTESDLYSFFGQIYAVDKSNFNYFMFQKGSNGYLWLFFCLLYCSFLTITDLIVDYDFSFDHIGALKFIILFISHAVLLSYFTLIIAALDELADRFKWLSYLWSSSVFDPSNCTPKKLECFRIIHGKLRLAGSSLHSAVSIRLAVYFLMVLYYLFYTMSEFYWNGVTLNFLGKFCLFTIKIISSSYAVIYFINKLNEQVSISFIFCEKSIYSF